MSPPPSTSSALSTSLIPQTRRFAESLDGEEDHEFDFLTTSSKRSRESLTASYYESHLGFSTDLDSLMADSHFATTESNFAPTDSTSVATGSTSSTIPWSSSSRGGQDAADAQLFVDAEEEQGSHRRSRSPRRKSSLTQYLSQKRIKDRIWTLLPPPQRWCKLPLIRLGRLLRTTPPSPSTRAQRPNRPRAKVPPERSLRMNLISRLRITMECSTSRWISFSRKTALDVSRLTSMSIPMLMEDNTTRSLPKQWTL